MTTVHEPAAPTSAYHEWVPRQRFETAAQIAEPRQQFHTAGGTTLASQHRPVPIPQCCTEQAGTAVQHRRTIRR